MLRSVRRLLALLVAVGLTASVPLCGTIRSEPVRESRLALVVGNARYQFPMPPLKGSVNDARGIMEALVHAGFGVTVVVDASLKTLTEAVSGFSGRIARGDVALFYYSGQAFQVAGETYLLPIDTGALDPSRGYSAQRVLARMEASGAKLSILILDAGVRLAPMNAGRGTFIAFASGYGGGARERLGESNGLFTKHLLAALRRPGLTLDQVFNSVRREVDKEFGGDQFPWFSSSVTGDFYFLPPNARFAPAAWTARVPRSTETVAHPGTSGSGPVLGGPGSGSPDLMPKLWTWALEGLAGLAGTCFLGFAALLLLAWRRGSAALSKSWLLSLAAKPMLAVPGSGRRLLFLGYSRRLASQRVIADASQRYFGLPAEHEGGIVPPDSTGNSLHSAIASAAGPQCPVLIVGSGGAGKSTLLARLAHLGLTGGLPPGLAGYRPMLIPASYYGGSLVKAVADTLRERDGVMLDEEMTRAQLESGRFLILFDGVSEVATERADALNEILRTARHADYASSRFLITSRPLEGAAVEAATFLLQPLAPAVVTKVLHSYNLGVARENRVRTQLERFGDRPIEPLLFTMILEQGADERFGTTRAEIFEQYFQRLLRIGSDKNRWEGWRDALEILSRYLMLDTGRRGAGLVHEKLLDLLGERETGGETVVSATTRLRRLYHLSVVDELDLLGKLDAAGLLRRGRRWRFAHDTFEEYFAASYLISYLEREDGLPPLEQWREPAERRREFAGVLSFLREMADEPQRRQLCGMDLPDAWKAELSVEDEGVAGSAPVLPAAATTGATTAAAHASRTAPTAVRRLDHSYKEDKPRGPQEANGHRAVASRIFGGVLLVAVLVVYFLAPVRLAQHESILDEARQAGRDAASFPAADEDYYHDMDGALPLTPSQVVGRNNWIVWTAGNDHLWDVLTQRSVGAFDLLKTISSYPYPKDSKLPQFGRHNRWSWLGLVNEPCFEEPKGPDPNRFGLWLDKRRADCPPDPFESETKYPGIKLGARGKNLPAGSYYGWGTGIVGLRLFPNPAFDEAAARVWDPVKYYSDPAYYQRNGLVRPYRVGMSCGFCHVGPSPIHPPKDPENPQWADLASNVGAQYFWIDRIFTWDADETSFPYQLFHTWRAGALDTSLVSTDSINNPRTMNAIYNLRARLDQGKRWGKETLAGGEADNKQFNDYFNSGPLSELFQKPNTVFTPRGLKDGSDSVGALGALNRVYVNMGLFSEEWLRHFNPLVGGKPITPIEIKVGRANSSFWQATEAQTPHVADFFLATTAPHLLKDAPGGAAYLTQDQVKLARGKEVFAERCARCHSSKLPASVAGLDPGGCAGPGYLDCWNKYWASTKTDEFKKQMREIVLKDDFLKDNFLSTEARVPVTLTEVNACSPLATNATAGNIWDNFSSHSYKSLPSVGTITVHNPFTGEPRPYTMPAGGRGYTRPASLISLWSTAPYLQNNTVGLFNGDPSVAGRMAAFQDGIEQMLWPEKRNRDPVLGDKVPGFIDRTSVPCYLRVAVGDLPPFAPELTPLVTVLAPGAVGNIGLELGPIPKGTPVNLLANLNILPDNQTPREKLAYDRRLLELLLRIKLNLAALHANATDEQARAEFKKLADSLLELSKCPDFVVNRGHYFGTDRFQEEPGLSDADKRALIEFLKTF